MLRLIKHVERRSRHLPPRQRFRHRAIACAAVGTAMYLITLLVGTIGFRLFDGCVWLDATLNATMLMSQLSHVTEVQHVEMKVFLLFYGPFAASGFYGGIGVLFAPWVDDLAKHFRLKPKV